MWIMDRAETHGLGKDALAHDWSHGWLNRLPTTVTVMDNAVAHSTDYATSFAPFWLNRSWFYLLLM